MVPLYSVKFSLVSEPQLAGLRIPIGLDSPVTAAPFFRPGPGTLLEPDHSPIRFGKKDRREGREKAG